MTARPDAINCAAWLADGNVQAFLRMIRVGEGTADELGYRRHFGGALFDSFSDHPRRPVTERLGGKPITSTAAGAYQFLAGTWAECARALGLADFSPRSQDLAAVFLVARRKAIDDVLAGRVEAAIAKCAREWASLPGSPYGQPTKTLAEALRLYADYGGQTQPAAQQATAPASADNPTPLETDMPLPVFAAAALPYLVEAIPKLGKLFGSGSAVAERNVKAAELVIDTVAGAVGAKNAQEAVEVLRTDPTAVAAAAKAVENIWFQLEEVGGGIEAARAQDDKVRASRDLLHSPSFWIALALLPLAYAIVGSVIGLWGQAWPADVRAAIATAVVSLVIGAVSGYYFGQTTSRNRTPQ